MANKMNDTSIEESRGNVFADLGFPYADREELKAKLMLEIRRSTLDRRLTQTAAGEILGIQQAHVSAFINGRSGNYSLDRLFEFLNALGRDVEIAVRPKAPEAEGAHTSVVVVQPQWSIRAVVETLWGERLHSGSGARCEARLGMPDR